MDWKNSKPLVPLRQGSSSLGKASCSERGSVLFNAYRQCGGFLGFGRGYYGSRDENTEDSESESETAAKKSTEIPRWWSRGVDKARTVEQEEKKEDATVKVFPSRAPSIPDKGEIKFKFRSAMPQSNFSGAGNWGKRSVKSSSPQPSVCKKMCEEICQRIVKEHPFIAPFIRRDLLQELHLEPSVQAESSVHLKPPATANTAKAKPQTSKSTCQQPSHEPFTAIKQKPLATLRTRLSNRSVHTNLDGTDVDLGRPEDIPGRASGMAACRLGRTGPVMLRKPAVNKPRARLHSIEWSSSRQHQPENVGRRVRSVSLPGKQARMKLERRHVETNVDLSVLPTTLPCKMIIMKCLCQEMYGKESSVDPPTTPHVLELTEKSRLSGFCSKISQDRSCRTMEVVATPSTPVIQELGPRPSSGESHQQCVLRRKEMPTTEDRISDILSALSSWGFANKTDSKKPKSVSFLKHSAPEHFSSEIQSKVKEMTVACAIPDSEVPLGFIEDIVYSEKDPKLVRQACNIQKAPKSAAIKPTERSKLMKLARRSVKSSGEKTGAYSIKEKKASMPGSARVDWKKLRLFKHHAGARRRSTSSIACSDTKPSVSKKAHSNKTPDTDNKGLSSVPPTSLKRSPTITFGDRLETERRKNKKQISSTVFPVERLENELKKDKSQTSSTVSSVDKSEAEDKNEKKQFSSNVSSVDKMETEVRNENKQVSTSVFTLDKMETEVRNENKQVSTSVFTLDKMETEARNVKTQVSSTGSSLHKMETEVRKKRKRNNFPDTVVPDNALLESKTDGNEQLKKKSAFTTKMKREDRRESATDKERKQTLLHVSPSGHFVVPGKLESRWHKTQTPASVNSKGILITKIVRRHPNESFMESLDAFADRNSRKMTFTQDVLSQAYVLSEGHDARMKPDTCLDGSKSREDRVKPTVNVLTEEKNLESVGNRARAGVAQPVENVDNENSKKLSNCEVQCQIELESGEEKGDDQSGVSRGGKCVTEVQNSDMTTESMCSRGTYTKSPGDAHGLIKVKSSVRTRQAKRHSAIGLTAKHSLGTLHQKEDDDEQQARSLAIASVSPSKLPKSVRAMDSAATGRSQKTESTQDSAHVKASKSARKVKENLKQNKILNSYQRKASKEPHEGEDGGNTARKSNKTKKSNIVEKPDFPVSHKKEQKCESVKFSPSKSSKKPSEMAKTEKEKSAENRSRFDQYHRSRKFVQDNSASNRTSDVRKKKSATLALNIHPALNQGFDVKTNHLARPAMLAHKTRLPAPQNTNMSLKSSKTLPSHGRTDSVYMPSIKRYSTLDDISELPSEPVTTTSIRPEPWNMVHKPHGVVQSFSAPARQVSVPRIMSQHTPMSVTDSENVPAIVKCKKSTFNPSSGLLKKSVLDDVVKGILNSKPLSKQAIRAQAN